MMCHMGVSLVSRAAEWAAIEKLLDAATTQAAGLVITGPAGIGKTALWLAGLDHARERGFRVLTARGSPAESALAYAAVADLLADIEPEVFDALPDVQHLAVKRILFQDNTDGGPFTDQRVAAAAVVAVIDRLSRTGSVLLAIDDAQWLDSSSRAVIAFAARRLNGRVGLLCTERTERSTAGGTHWLQLSHPEALSRIQMTPMSLAGLHDVLMSQLGRSLPRPTLVHIAEAAGGNPLYAVELARALDNRRPHSPLVLPATLADLIAHRTERFDEHTQRALLAAACMVDPTVDLIAEATAATTRRVVDLLEAPERNGVITIEGNRVRFTHPLLARATYTSAGAAARRRMHRALAHVEGNLELKARHLALSSTDADPEVVSALDDAATAARARGAPSAAAELLELAIGLGADTSGRRIRAAKHCLQGGDADRALALLEPTLADHSPGPTRAAALHLHAGILTFRNNFGRAADVLTDALSGASGDERLAAQIHLGLAMALGMSGGRDIPIRHAEEAVRLAEAAEDPSLISQAVAMETTLRCADGQGLDAVRLHGALELESPDNDVPIAFRASAVHALMQLWTGRLEQARLELGEVHRRCLERGVETDLVWVVGHRFFDELWLGDYPSAAATAAELMQRGQQQGSDHATIIATYQRALIAAYEGREDEARDGAMAAITSALQSNALYMMLWPAMALAFLDTSLGRYDEALATMQPLLARLDPADGACEIFASSFVPDAIESLIAVGRHDEAVPLIDALEKNGRRLDRPWLLAVGARCRAMHLAAVGDLKQATAVVVEAMEHHQRLPMPFETARTQLLHGQLERRQRRIHSAVTILTESAEAFDSLGTPLWAARARHELVRTKVSRNNDLELTQSERRVAELAGGGKTNRDIAAMLFISHKTVEQHITRIYRKLGVTNRAALARRIKPPQH